MRSLVAAVGLVACGSPAQPVVEPSAPTGERCDPLGAPTLVRNAGAAVLQYWELEDRPVLYSPVLPDDPMYARFRAAIHAAKADIEHPIADAPVAKSDEERELWRKEDANKALAYSGRGGEIRPIHCLEAALFAYQNARYSELTQPTELMASIVAKQVAGKRMLRVYFTAGDTMFPPKQLYAFPEVERDIAMGWEYLVMLHNHTVQKHGDQPALGVTVPSASDIQLLRHLAEDDKLQSGWVTNGVYTIEVPASAFGTYVARE